MHPNRCVRQIWGFSSCIFCACFKNCLEGQFHLQKGSVRRGRGAVMAVFPFRPREAPPLPRWFTASPAPPRRRQRPPSWWPSPPPRACAPWPRWQPRPWSPPTSRLCRHRQGLWSPRSRQVMILCSGICSSSAKKGLRIPVDPPSQPHNVGCN